MQRVRSGTTRRTVEEIPYLGSLPDLVTVLRIVLDDGQDAAGHDAMRFAEVAIDLLERECDLLL